MNMCLVYRVSHRDLYRAISPLLIDIVKFLFIKELTELITLISVHWLSKQKIVVKQN